MADYFPPTFKDCRKPVLNALQIIKVEANSRGPWFSSRSCQGGSGSLSWGSDASEQKTSSWF